MIWLTVTLTFAPTSDVKSYFRISEGHNETDLLYLSDFMQLYTVAHLS